MASLLDLSTYYHIDCRYVLYEYVVVGSATYILL
jgi:hypothetical protein